MKWKFLLAGLLVVGLLAGGTASALTESTAQSISGLAAISAEEAVDELDGIAETEIIPVTEPGDRVTIDGGFRGVWGVDPKAEEPLGHIVGLYGTVTRADGTTYGFMGGVYTNKNGKLGGFLTGKYADGTFRGNWHSATSEASGLYGNTYDVNTEDVEAVVNSFVGEWQTSDGERAGYMKGRYSAVVSIRMAGRFGGKWAINDDEASVEAVRPEADGNFRGHYGIIKFADGTQLRYFRGGWNSEDSEAKGKLQGIGIRGHFYGVWRSADGEANGYLTGRYNEHKFRGVVGTMGEEPSGKLWGKYGRLPQELEPLPERAKLQLAN